MKIEFFFIDTDSYYLEFKQHTRNTIIEELASWLDLSNLDEEDKYYSSEKKCRFFNLKIDTGSKNIMSFIGIKKKAYQISFGENEYKTKLKGCPSAQISLIKEYQISNILVKKNHILNINDIFRFGITNHTIRMVNYSKSVLNEIDMSSRYLDCGLCTIPFNYFNKDIKCSSIDCEKKKILLSIYNRLCK